MTDGECGSRNGIDDRVRRCGRCERSRTIDAFLGTKPRPWWRRWMKVWLPLLVLVILALALSRCMGGDEQPNYITEEVVSPAVST